MILTEIQYSRTLLKGNNDMALYMTSANPFLFNEKNDFVIWNDDIGVVIVTKSNVNPNIMENQDKPIATYVIPYSAIEFMCSHNSEDEYTNGIAKPLITEGLMTDGMRVDVLTKLGGTKDLKNFL